LRRPSPGEIQQGNFTPELKSDEARLFDVAADRAGVLEDFRQAGNDLAGSVEDHSVLRAGGTILVRKVMVEAGCPERAVRAEGAPEHRMPSRALIDAPQLRPSRQL
jgi:hypothetical protein